MAAHGVQEDIKLYRRGDCPTADYGCAQGHTGRLRLQRIQPYLAGREVFGILQAGDVGR